MKNKKCIEELMTSYSKLYKNRIILGKICFFSILENKVILKRSDYVIISYYHGCCCLFNDHQLIDTVKPLQHNRPIIFLLKGCLVIYAGLFLCHELSFVSSPIGHYLKMGELLIEKGIIVSRNIFSYNDYDAPIINNNTFLAVFYFLIHKVLGWNGLHLLLIAFYLFVVGLWYRALEHKTFPIWSMIIALLMIPLLFKGNLLLASQWSFGIAAIYAWLIYQYIDDKLQQKWLWIVPFLQFIWVNSHTNFLLGWGLLLLGAMQLYSIKPSAMKHYYTITIACVALTFLNPSFIEGVWHPVEHLWTTYSEATLQEVTLWTAYQEVKAHFLLYALTVVVIGFIIIAMLLIRFSNKQQFFLRATAFLMLLTGFLSAGNTAFIALGFWILGMECSSVYEEQFNAENFATSYQSPVLFMYVLLPFFLSHHVSSPFKEPQGLGIDETAMNAMHFLQNNQIKGPLFNNRLATGYLVNGLYDQEEYPFVNDYLGAHSTEFLQTAYFPALLDESLWHQAKLKYDFSTIIFALKNERHSYLEFLGRRLGDGEWALVYHEVDEIAILLRRSQQNQQLINQYELPLQ